jgi:hypothetical protein
MVLAWGAGASVARARTIEEVEPFAGNLLESFESFLHFNLTGRTPLPCGTGVFGNAAVLLDSRAGVYQPNLSPFFILDAVTEDAAQVLGDGSQGLGTGILRGESAVTAIQFGGPVRQFGGLWASGEEVVVRFLDDAGQAVGSAEFLPTPLSTFDGTLVWKGWSSTQDFVRVELEGINVAVDDLRATSVATDDPGTTVFDELCNSGGSPAVATDGLGRSARVWAAADSLTDTSSVGVYVEVVDGSGARIAGPARLSQRVDGDQQQPALAADGAGFAAVWQEERSGQSNILGRTFRLEPKQGNPQELELILGQERRINEPIEDPGDQPRIAPRGGGEWAVAWRSRNRVLLRALDSGAQPVAEAEIAGDGTGGVVDSPALVRTAAGDLVVAWAFRASGAAAGAATAAASSVLGRRFEKNGVPLGPAEPASLPGSVPAAVDVTATPDGRTLVVWSEDEGSTQPAGKISGRWLGGGVAPVGGPLELGHAGTREARPRASTGGDGAVAVVWENRGASFVLPDDPTGADRRSAARRGAAQSQAAQSIVGVVFPPGALDPEPEVELVAGDAEAAPVTPDVSAPTRHDIRLVYAKQDGVGRERGVFSKRVAASGGCAPTAQRLCLGGGRFAVEVSWTSGSDAGEGHAVPLTADTGTFWFFDDDNVELVVKVLEGCELNDHFWVFAGGLTDVAVELRVTDTAAGQSRTYSSPAGTGFEPILDTAALSTCGASATTTLAGATAAWYLGIDAAPAGAFSSACATGGDTLCVADDRFTVRVSWRAADGASGSGQATALTSDTGYFWFFDDDNVEIVVKVLNACVINDRFWVFAGGLTDVEAELEVVDTQTGARRTYSNPLGRPFAPIQDTGAFATCP